MDDSVTIKKRVKVLALYTGTPKDGACMPVRMIYRGREYNFTELGLRHPTQQGKRMVHVFDMSDGSADYRLEFDAEQLVWDLISISDKYYES